MATGSENIATAAPVYRRAVPADLPQLWALLERYYRDWNVVQRDTPEHVLAYVSAPAPFGFTVAEQNSTVLGCVLLRELRSTEHAAECKRLFVLPEMRGRGIAGELMQGIEAAARDAGLRWIYLDSTEAFSAAIAMYRKRGYVACDRFNDNPQATVFLRKRLL